MPEEEKKVSFMERYGLYPDMQLLFVILFIALFGLIMIYSASYYTASIGRQGDESYFVVRQARVLILGTVVMCMVALLDYHKYVRLCWLWLILSLILMVATDFTSLGVTVNGARRWLGYRGIRLFQSSEAVKITVILTMAAIVTRFRERLAETRVLGMIALLILPLDLLVMKENLSAGIIILGIAFGMYFVACRSKGIFVLLFLLILIVGYAAVNLAQPLADRGILDIYQASRIAVWRDPNRYADTSGYQVLQGLYAVGSGGFFGKGLGNSTQKLAYLPEAQNDLIFAVICEELGLFGAICVMGLFLFMLYRMMVIANNAPDIMGSMVTVGVMAHIAIQVFLNIAVTINLIPNTGISLPFISYGGTSLLFLMIEMGMVLGVSLRIRIKDE